MRRVCIFVAILLCPIFLFFGLVTRQVRADVNDFSFSSFEADYYLSKDNEGRSTMKVVERLTAEFNNFNQNKGIERAIPNYYDGHSTSFKLESLTRNGQTEPIYEQKNDGKFIVVSTGTDEYLNGTQKYEFTYSLRDVTKDFGDHQELYWDTNGTGWKQSFDKASVNVHLDKSVITGFTGAISCYEGVSESKKSCNSELVDKDTIRFNSTGLLAGGENLSFDLSFKKDTFAGYQITSLDIIPYIFVSLSGVLFIAAIVIKLKFGRDFPSKRAIIAEYLPPRDVSVLFASEVFGDTTNSLTAQIIDLAVKHKIRIIESKEKVLFINKTKYTLELINVNDLNQDELKVIDIFFGNLTVGSKYTFNENDYQKGAMVRELNKKVRNETEEQGYRNMQTKIKILQMVVIGVSFFFLFISSFILEGNDLFIWFIVALFVEVLLVASFSIGSIRPLTKKGRELKDYLEGLEMYIKLAEKDRLKVLQSPSGAEKKSINTDNTSKMIVLYERVLPYAVLFGQETDWVKQIGNYYEINKTQPDWYLGTSGFNAVAFSSSISSFSSYSNSSSYSSSSGAGGGGFSGGGGGGGGGGGR